MTVYYPPQNFIPADQYGDRFWMHRLMSPVWAYCDKGHHDAPFHVEVEGEIGSMEPTQALWACSKCGYRYPPECEPEPHSMEWHQEQLSQALADAGIPHEGDDETSRSALAWWLRHHEPMLDGPGRRIVVEPLNDEDRQ